MRINIYNDDRKEYFFSVIEQIFLIENGIHLLGVVIALGVVTKQGDSRHFH